MDSSEIPDESSLLGQQIRNLGPWHQDIRINDSISTGMLFSPTGKLERSENQGVSLLNLEPEFQSRMARIFPEGLAGRRVLDCACNAGGYAFWSRALGADFCFGFDAREHWINQARFVQQHRVAGPTDRIRFVTCDLYDLEKKQLPQFNLSIFKGIFYHLPDPVHALKIVADRTSEVLYLNTQTAWGLPDGSLQVTVEDVSKLMSGMHGLSWRPTGPMVMVPIFHWLGFRSVRLMFFKPVKDNPKLGRMSMFAARDPDRLKGLEGSRELMEADSI